MSRRSSVFAALCLGSLLANANYLIAQDVRWRHDYASARKEAMETGRPLLLDFGTEACMWCKKLDATTFRARPIADALNTRFIAVKVDAERAPKLVQALGIEAYPEVIVAAPDGTILGRHKGYADVGEMTGLMENALRRMPKPQTVVPVAAVMPASQPAPVSLASRTAVEKGDPAREEIALKLSQVYLERGADLCRRGRTAEGTQYLEVASTLCPTSPTAGTAREMLDKLQRGDAMPRP